VDTAETAPTKSIFSDFDEVEVGQVWAEAVNYYRAGELLYLSAELEEQAADKQADHLETDERAGGIQRYLDTLLPSQWEEMDAHQRRSFLLGDTLQEPGTKKRERVCVAEVWVELFGRPQSEMTRYNTRDIHTILRSFEEWQEEASKHSFKLYGKVKSYRRVDVPIRPKPVKRTTASSSI